MRCCSCYPCHCSFLPILVSSFQNPTTDRKLVSEVIEAAQIMRSSEHERRLSSLDEIALLVRMEETQDLRRSRAERSQETNEPIRPLRRKNRVSTSKS